MDNPQADGLWVAQDTGGAIRGANRFDTFWGAGAEAAVIAGGMQARGRACAAAAARPCERIRAALRRLSAEEQALWRRVVESVRPLHGLTPRGRARARRQRRGARRGQARAAEPRRAQKAAPGTTLDGSWDRRLSRGLVQPDRILDLHGHSLATAYDLLDRRLDQAVARRVRGCCC